MKPFLKIQNHISSHLLLTDGKNHLWRVIWLMTNLLSGQSNKHVRHRARAFHFQKKNLKFPGKLHFYYNLHNNCYIQTNKQTNNQTEENLDFYLSKPSACHFTSLAFKWTLWISKKQPVIFLRQIMTHFSRITQEHKQIFVIMFAPVAPSPLYSDIKACSDFTLGLFQHMVLHIDLWQRDE